MTRFYIRNDRETGFQKPKRLSRKSYKKATTENSERGMPIRVHTTYVDGVPCKELILLPFPLGFTR